MIYLCSYVKYYPNFLPLPFIFSPLPPPILLEILEISIHPFITSHSPNPYSSIRDHKVYHKLELSICCWKFDAPVFPLEQNIFTQIIHSCIKSRINPKAPKTLVRIHQTRLKKTHLKTTKENIDINFFAVLPCQSLIPAITQLSQDPDISHILLIY